MQLQLSSKQIMQVVASGSGTTVWELSDMQRSILSSTLEWIPCRLQTQLESFQVGFNFKCILPRVERCSLALTLSLRYWKPAAERLPKVCVCARITPYHQLNRTVFSKNQLLITRGTSQGPASHVLSLSLRHVLFGSFIPLSFTPSPFRFVYASLPLSTLPSRRTQAFLR